MTLLDAPTFAAPIHAIDAEQLADLDLIEPEDMHLYGNGRALFELVDGRLVEKHMSDVAQFTAETIDDVVDAWVKANDAGRVFSERSFQYLVDRPRTVRLPDVAFVTKAKLDGYVLGNAHIRLAPDLAIEVVSPGDSWNDVDTKVAEYHSAGIPLVWVANPISRRVFVEPNPATGQKPVMLLADDTLTAAELLPGFACRVGDLFPAVPPTPAPAGA